RAGDIQHLSFGPGESMTHDLANIGDTELIFTTVEFLDSANPPLALPAAVRAEATCRAGDIQHLSFGPGESMTHDLANIGDTELIFTTV
ncbi:hypothetical protein CTI14_65355, partial [Methylobacterium radiotolerans]